MRELIHKALFTNQLLKLDGAHVARIVHAVADLCESPQPDGQTKKAFMETDLPIGILNCDDVNIWYRFDATTVTLLNIAQASDIAEAAMMRSLAPEPEKRWLQGSLFDPDEVAEPVHEMPTSSSVSHDLLRQPDYLTGQPEALLQFHQGDLISFLLRLSPEQERMVKRSIDGHGPVLVKGGPGTGKSIVAIYRTREMLWALKRAHVASPRVLFTTFTGTLVKATEQLLRMILGREINAVEVDTADRITARILGSFTIAPHGDQRQMMRVAIKNARYVGEPLVQRKQEQAVNSLGVDGLLNEINNLIEARMLTSLGEYATALRPKQWLRLDVTQRGGVWSVRDAFYSLLNEARLSTWEQARSCATRMVEAQQDPPYDAVLIDEAQDLTPSAIRMLVALCKSPNRLFLTADANQSIYNTSFHWSDIHEQLQFTGRTSILRMNFRSTRQIASAAQSYLAASALESEPIEETFRFDGPLPVVRAVTTPHEEIALIRRFLHEATNSLHVGLDGCAILCPTNERAQDLVARLNAINLPATFMSRDTFDLARPEIKVMTLHSAKGLEFPIVALDGWRDKTFSYLATGTSVEAREMAIACERRTLYVGMTRAMRGLLVITPAGEVSALMTGFDPRLWNVE